jgi:hypothetical protein
MIRFHWLHGLVAASAVTASTAFLVAYQPPATPPNSVTPPPGAPAIIREVPPSAELLPGGISSQSPPPGDVPTWVTRMGENGQVYTYAISDPSRSSVPTATGPVYLPPAYGTNAYSLFPPAADQEEVVTRKQLGDLEAKVTTQLEAYFAAKGDAVKQEAIRKDLTALVEEEFKVRMEMRSRQVAKLEEQAKALREKIDQRTARREAIVGRRVSELLREKSEDAWDDSAAGTPLLHLYERSLPGSVPPYPVPFGSPPTLPASE